MAHVHREHLADVTFLHQLAHVQVRRRRAPLQADHRVQLLLARERRELFGFLVFRAQRPFAVDVLARFERASRELVVRGHPHRDECRFDRRGPRPSPCTSL